MSTLSEMLATGLVYLEHKIEENEQLKSEYLSFLELYFKMDNYADSLEAKMDRIFGVPTGSIFNNLLDYPNESRDIISSQTLRHKQYLLMLIESFYMEHQRVKRFVVSPFNLEEITFINQGNREFIRIQRSDKTELVISVDDSQYFYIVAKIILNYPSMFNHLPETQKHRVINSLNDLQNYLPSLIKSLENKISGG